MTLSTWPTVDLEKSALGAVRFPSPLGTLSVVLLHAVGRRERAFGLHALGGKERLFATQIRMTAESR